MTDLLEVIGVTLVALAIVAAVVIGGQDATYFVSPPEAVAESFTREIAAKRYDRALQYLHTNAGVTEEDVRIAGESLHSRAGAIDNVEGEPAEVGRDESTASARLTTAKGGPIRYRFRLARARYVWKIVEWTGR